MEQKHYWIGIILIGIIILFLMPVNTNGQVLDSLEWKQHRLPNNISFGMHNDKKNTPLKWWKPTKNDFVIWGLFSLSGAADGINQSILHHKLGEGNSFWDQKTSWKRKYKDFDGGDKSAAYFGSKSFLVWTTDGFHLTRAIGHASMYFAIGISTSNLKQYQRKDRWKVVAKRIAGSALARAILFTIIYNNTGK